MGIPNTRRFEVMLEGDKINDRTDLKGCYFGWSKNNDRKLDKMIKEMNEKIHAGLYNGSHPVGWPSIIKEKVDNKGDNIFWVMTYIGD